MNSSACSKSVTYAADIFESHAYYISYVSYVLVYVHVTFQGRKDRALTCSETSQLCTFPFKNTIQRFPLLSKQHLLI